MWKYISSTGEMYTPDGLLLTIGYSGNDDNNVDDPDDYKNDPSKDNVRGLGVIPDGFYTISKPFTHEKMGKVCMRLTPKEGTDTHGRSGFLIHGDSIKNPGTASHGCIILNRAARIMIGNSEDKTLHVIAKK